MKIIKNIVIILLFGLFSCNNQQSDQHSIKFNSSDSLQTEIDGLYINKIDSAITSSIFQVELSLALKNQAIDNYYKEIYKKEQCISAADTIMLSITDSLFTADKETDLFYFIVFTKSMNGADGFYSEALGLSAFDFFYRKTAWFTEYFNIAEKLTEKDMDNWAYYIYSEIKISREGEESKAIKELETVVLENIKKSRKEYRTVLENFIDKIKKYRN